MKTIKFMVATDPALYGPNASPQEQAYFAESVRRRERLAIEVGENLVRARDEGITQEQASEVARLLREKAESMRAAKPEATAAAATPAGPAAPQPAKLSATEIDKVIVTLLGQKDGQEVSRILEGR